MPNYKDINQHSSQGKEPYNALLPFENNSIGIFLLGT